VPATSAPGLGRPPLGLAVALGLPLVLALGWGCGRGEPTARLVGQVTIGGKPPTGSVMVVAEDASQGISAAAAVDAAGTFDVLTAPGRGLPVGRYQVAVIPTPPPIEDLDESLTLDAAPPPDTSGIPARFQSPATSGLSVDVQPPETRFDIAVPR
jgi:hypothetical protein